MNMVKLTVSSARAMVLAMVACAFVLSYAAPTAQAQADASELVDVFEAELAEAIDAFEDQKQLLQMEIVNVVRAAQDAGDLKLVLKLEKQYTKRIGKTIKPFRNAVSKAQKSVLKQIKKRRKFENAAKLPTYELEAREIADSRRADIDELERQLRFQLSNAVEAAVNALTR